MRFNTRPLYQLLIVEVEVQGLYKRQVSQYTGGARLAQTLLTYPATRPLPPSVVTCVSPGNLFHQVLLRYVRVETQKSTHKIDISISR